jgi:hypothetical protein
MSADKPYVVEIIDWAPDVLEYRAVADQDWSKIDFPPEAYFFAFYDRARGRPVSDWFYLTLDPRLFTPEEAAAEFPAYAEEVKLWADKGVKFFANHSYDCDGYKGNRVIPMIPQVVLIDRTAMTQVWPPQQ